MYWGLFGITPLVLYFLLNKYYRPVLLFSFIAAYSSTNYNICSNLLYVNEALSSRATMDSINEFYSAYCVNAEECRIENLYVSETLRNFTPNNNGVVTRITSADLIKIHKYIKNNFK